MQKTDLGFAGSLIHTRGFGLAQISSGQRGRSGPCGHCPTEQDRSVTSLGGRLGLCPNLSPLKGTARVGQVPRQCSEWGKPHTHPQPWSLPVLEHPSSFPTGFSVTCHEPPCLEPHKLSSASSATARHCQNPAFLIQVTTQSTALLPLSLQATDS